MLSYCEHMWNVLSSIVWQINSEVIIHWKERFVYKCSRKHFHKCFRRNDLLFYTFGKILDELIKGNWVLFEKTWFKFWSAIASESFEKQFSIEISHSFLYTMIFHMIFIHTYRYLVIVLNKVIIKRVKLLWKKIKKKIIVNVQNLLEVEETWNLFQITFKIVFYV